MASHNSSNTEFTRKLRAAVKAKLEEFGLDVDEELPDYVMIMVGNKKDKGRMKSELKLFLGDNTSPFVEWLFGFFQKVKTVTASINEEVAKEKNPKAELVEGPCKSKASQEKKKHSKEKASKREEAPEPVKKDESHRSRKPRIEAPASPKARNEGKERKKEHRHPPVEATKPKKEKEKEKHSHRKHNPSSERYEEYLTNSDYEDEEVPAREIPKVKVKSEVKHEKVEKTTRRSKKDSPKRERLLTQALPKREEKRRDEPVVSARQPNVPRSKPSRRNELRPISYEGESDVSGREPSPLPHKKNIRSSYVDQSSNFDDPPPPKLSSKVVVMQRKTEKPSQPNSRANPSIFKRAISDAASFSAAYGSRKKKIPEKKRGIQLDYEDEQPTAKKSRDKLSSYINYSQNEENGAAKNTRIIVTVKNSDKDDHYSGVTVKNEADIEEEEDKDVEQDLEEEEAELEPKTIKKEEEEDVIKGSEMQEEKSEEQVEEGRSDVEENLADNDASNEDHKVIAAVMSHLKRKRRADDLTRAFLKLSGINPKVARLLQETEQQQSKKTPTMPSNLCSLTTESLQQPAVAVAATTTTVESASVKTEQKSEIVQTVQITNFQESLKSITRTIMNTGKNSADSSPNTPVTPVWDGQINLDDFSSSDDEAEIDALLATAQAVRSANNNEAHEIIPPTAILSRPSMFKSGSTGSYATLGYNPSQYQPAYVPPVRAVLTNSKIAERCRFWPDCRNEDICPFHHPTKPCANFPNCWFGDKCLYLHPRCRYGPNCSKPKCQFMHTKLPPVTSTAPTVTFASSSSTTSAPTNSHQNSAPFDNGKEKEVNQDSATSSQSPAAAPLPVNSMPPPNQPATTGPDVPLASPPSSVIAKNNNILCRYAGKCQNINCTYKHPPPCRFGSNCMNFNYCSFLHRKPGFAANRYKWVAPSLSS